MWEGSSRLLPEGTSSGDHTVGGIMRNAQPPPLHSTSQVTGYFQRETSCKSCNTSRKHAGQVLILPFNRWGEWSPRASVTCPNLCGKWIRRSRTRNLYLCILVKDSSSTTRQLLRACLSDITQNEKPHGPTVWWGWPHLPAHSQSCLLSAPGQICTYHGTLSGLWKWGQDINLAGYWATGLDYHGSSQDTLMSSKGW